MVSLLDLLQPNDGQDFRHLMLMSLMVMVLSVVFYTRIAVSRDKGPLPPGPAPGWKHNAPMFRSYDDLIQKHGPVVSFQRGDQIQVLIGTYQAAVDIMQKFGSDLADTPASVSANDILSGGKRILLIGAGKRMVSYRKAFHGSLQPSSATQYEPVQYQNSKNYILDILRDPANHLAHARKYAASVILTITYGKTTPTSYDDPEVVAINGGTVRLMHVIKHFPWPVDRYPILRYLPLPHVCMLRKYHNDEAKLFLSQLDTVRRSIANHTARPSFSEYLLEHQKELGIGDEDLAYLAGSMFGAGSDTTGSGLGIVIMAAATHPAEQAQCQAEIDSIVGRDRVPTFDDLKSLPLTVAFSMEAHRWRPIIPMGLNHRASKDLHWNGYIIPKGASVTGVAWSIMHDPAVFQEPEEFKPSRWVTEEGGLRDDIKHFDFGFGRRVCPGVHVAERSLAMTTAHLLWAFNVQEDRNSPVDAFGLTDAPITHPLPFVVNFVPRINNLQQIIMSS